MLIFSNVDLLTLDFKLTWIFYLAHKMLKVKVPMLSLEEVQIVINCLTNEDLPKFLANLVAKTIVALDEVALKIKKTWSFI